MNFQGVNKLSLLDYPGKVAAILYIDKCNFHCEFCHNWNTLLSMPVITFFSIVIEPSFSASASNLSNS